MKKTSAVTPPERLEGYLLRAYPTLEEITEWMLGRKESVRWPEWCYLPMAASYGIVSGGADIPIAKRYVSNNLNYLEAMSAILPWRLHKVIFRFDPDLTDELTAKDTLPEDIPASLLFHMPYPCVFIAEPPGVDDCDGVFFFLEWDHRYPQAVELRAHYLFSDDRIVYLYYQYADDRAALASEFNKNVEKTIREVGNTAAIDRDFDPIRWRQCMDNMPKHLSMLVYLCSDEPDISRRSEVPRRRGRGVIKTPNWPDKVDVGRYIGSTIRMGRELQRKASDDDGEGGTGSPRRPHMRRAHWHLYWTGSGRTVPRVKWLAPIFVGGDGGSVPVVDHTVK